MTIHHSHLVYDSHMVTPDMSGQLSLRRKGYQLTVGDIIEFADHLREAEVPTETLIYDTAALHPSPILGLMTMGEERLPISVTGDVETRMCPDCPRPRGHEGKCADGHI